MWTWISGRFRTEVKVLVTGVGGSRGHRGDLGSSGQDKGPLVVGGASPCAGH